MNSPFFAKGLTKQSYRSQFSIGNVMFYLKLSVLIILSIELHTSYNPLVIYSNIYIKKISFLIDFLIFFYENTLFHGVVRMAQ